MSMNVMPTPLSPISTGNPKADAAIAKLAAFELSPHSPAERPGGKDYDALVKIASSIPAKKLVTLLDDNAVQTGRWWWDERAQKLRSVAKKAFEKHHEAVGLAVKTRQGYLAWLMSAAMPEGFPRVLEVAADEDAPTAARLVASRALEGVHDKKLLKKVATAIDPHAWDGKDQLLERVYRSAVRCLQLADPKAAYKQYVDLVDPKLVDKGAGKRRAEAVLYGILGTAADARWVDALIPLLKTKSCDNLALMKLEELPPDPRTADPIMDYLGKEPDKVTWFNDTALRVLSKVPNARALKYFVAALRASWMAWPAAFDAFEKAGDPAMAHVIREWLAKNGAPDRDKRGKEVIGKLEKRGKAPKPTGKLLAPKPEPARTRPTLVYKPTKPVKGKHETLAQQETAFVKLFAKGDLADFATKLPQRAVWLIPKRVDEATLALGTTKLGGHPDLPPGTDWPRVKGEPLTFLAQVRLEEVVPHLPAKHPLPKAGLLSFFIGNDPLSKKVGYLDEARVIFTKSAKKLERFEVPEDFVDQIFQACAVDPKAALRLPSPSNKHVTELLDSEQVERYEADVFVDQAAWPQLLGFRNHGYDAEEPSSAQLLLQLTGDSQSDMEFGDCDFLAIYIDKKKLAAGDFSKVWPHVGD